MGLILPVILYILTLLLEGIIYIALSKNSPTAKYISLATIILTVFSATVISVTYFSLFSLLLTLISIFRSINLGRVYTARLNSHELFSRYTATAIQLGFFSSLSIYMSVYFRSSINPYSLNYVVVFSFLGSVVLLSNTLFNLHKWRAKQMLEIVDSRLPTVSVCIPARNETQDLPGCIESILSSTYPKLEVIVLDDCSHDKTPAIIKEFAHQGVRFISGEEPNDDWLAKNQAMDKLFFESRGDITIFAGVDTRFSADTVTQIVSNMQGGIQMLSIIPRRSVDHESTVFIQPLRYWWELASPKLFSRRPPILSTCWAISRKALISTGGFQSFRKSVQPEAHIAKKLKSVYRLVISGNRLGLTSSKSPREQADTAIRTRYPQAKRRPETVLNILIIEFVVFIVPLLGIMYAFNSAHSSFVFAISVSTIIANTITNIVLSRLTVSRLWLIGVVSLPFLIAEEWYILVRSMLAYEFGTVVWKERNICLPMLRIDKKLPDIDL